MPSIYRATCSNRRPKLTGNVLYLEGNMDSDKSAGVLLFAAALTLLYFYNTGRLGTIFGTGTGSQGNTPNQNPNVGPTPGAPLGTDPQGKPNQSIWDYYAPGSGGWWLQQFGILPPSKPNSTPGTLPPYTGTPGINNVPIPPMPVGANGTPKPTGSVDSPGGWGNIPFTILTSPGYG